MRAIDRLMEGLLKGAFGSKVVLDLDSECLQERAALRSSLGKVEDALRALRNGPRAKALGEARDRAERLEKEAARAIAERDRLAWLFDHEVQTLLMERQRLTTEISGKVPMSVQLLVEEIGQKLSALAKDAAGRSRAEALHRLQGRAYELAEQDAAGITAGVAALRREVQSA